ncbi:uncharacterized protein LOC116805535 [Drosophila grimshawi]|uniref:uncharacterized protein LOC116805535 n=1 Tax=Drosophila grimshawi TaxID=7222 RepID=UPI000C86E7E4|nr:uncharacterized protein LOC116805535 [Drosophila grimshawi]
MPLESQRYKYYKAQLSELLHTTIVHIRNYYDTLNTTAPHLITQANRLWELSQRQHLVAGVDQAAEARLLISSQVAHQSIHKFLNRQNGKLAEIAKQVADFERESNALTEELGEVPKSQLCPLADWRAWLSQALSVLQTQAKYLELHSHSLLPKLVQASTVKQFKEDLQLAQHYEASFRMGLATAERRPELLPMSMAIAN